MKVTVSGTIYWDPNPAIFRATPEEHFTWHQFDGPFLGCIEVRPHTIEFEVPDDFDPRPAQVERLQEQLRLAGAAFEAKRTEILAKIQELTAIEAPTAGETRGGDSGEVL